MIIKCTKSHFLVLCFLATIVWNFTSLDINYLSHNNNEGFNPTNSNGNALQDHKDEALRIQYGLPQRKEHKATIHRTRNITSCTQQHRRPLWDNAIPQIIPIGHHEHPPRFPDVFTFSNASNDEYDDLDCRPCQGANFHSVGAASRRNFPTSTTGTLYINRDSIFHALQGSNYTVLYEEHTHQYYVYREAKQKYGEEEIADTDMPVTRAPLDPNQIISFNNHPAVTLLTGLNVTLVFLNNNSSNVSFAEINMRLRDEHQKNALIRSAHVLLRCDVFSRSDEHQPWYQLYPPSNGYPYIPCSTKILPSKEFAALNFPKHNFTSQCQNSRYAATPFNPVGSAPRIPNTTLAVVLGGFMRELAVSITSLRSHVLEYSHTAHVYVSTWNVEGQAAKGTL
eukprot:PhF_6_TR37100/c0_g1_i2/m.54475